MNNSVKEITVDSSDNIYVTDSGRNEVVIIRNCTRARKGKTTKFHVLKVKRLISSAVIQDQVDFQFFSKEVL